MSISAQLSEAAAPQYVGLMLDAGSRKRLHAWWAQEVAQPLLANAPPEDLHVTIFYRPTAAQLAGVEAGKRLSVRVIGWVSDDRAQAAIVSGVEVHVGYVAHVTLATAPGVKPVQAGKLANEGFTRANGPTLTGVVKVVPVPL